MDWLPLLCITGLVTHLSLVVAVANRRERRRARKLPAWWGTPASTTELIVGTAFTAVFHLLVIGFAVGSVAPASRAIAIATLGISLVSTASVFLVARRISKPASMADTSRR